MIETPTPAPWPVAGLEPPAASRRVMRSMTWVTLAIMLTVQVAATLGTWAVSRDRGATWRQRLFELPLPQVVTSGLPITGIPSPVSSVAGGERKVAGRPSFVSAQSREWDGRWRRTITPSELELLARLVHAEARGEPYEGKVAVAATVLNRLDDPRFPGTVEGVVYEQWAFTAVADGQMALTPDRSAYQAVLDALAGWDPTHGAVYYYNPATATSGWIWSRPVIKQIGNHLFAR